MTSWSPGRKYEQVVAPLPLETGMNDGGFSPTRIRKIRSQAAVAGRACRMSCVPSNDQYASAFSPPNVSGSKSAKCPSAGRGRVAARGVSSEGAGRPAGADEPPAHDASDSQQIEETHAANVKRRLAPIIGRTFPCPTSCVNARAKNCLLLSKSCTAPTPL